MKQPPSGTREESRTTLQPTAPRIVGALLVVAGVVHLLAPTVLLKLARRGYRTVLNVEFEPLPGATNRVRALGAGFVATGAHLLYYGGILPSDE